MPLRPESEQYIPTLRTGSQQYMTALKYAHEYIDRGYIIIAQRFLDMARWVCLDLEKDAEIIYYIDRLIK